MREILSTAPTATLCHFDFGSGFVGGLGGYSPLRGVVAPNPTPCARDRLTGTDSTTREKWHNTSPPPFTPRPMVEEPTTPETDPRLVLRTFITSLETKRDAARELATSGLRSRRDYWRGYADGLVWALERFAFPLDDDTGRET